MFKSLIFAAIVAVAIAYSPKYTGNAWQSGNAPTKTNTLYNRVMENTKNNGWYSARLAELFVENLNRSFEFVGDDMPGQNLFDLEERPKLIHSVGAVAQARYVDLGGHNYTGIFKGCSNAFIRFSLATPPAPSTPNMVPGISMKFLRSGVKSGNVFSMYSLVGQSSFNFFAHDLTNHAPAPNPNDPTVPTTQKLLLKAFSTASAWPSYLGLSDLALYDQNGAKSAVPIFPYRVIFHPVKAVHKLFPDAPQSGDSFFLNQLATMGAGPVYEVWVQATPASNTTGPIGRIDMVTSPSSSMFGDKDMFFQHTRKEDDMKYRPDWIPGMNAIIAQQQSVRGGYLYPDLPFN